MSKLSAHDRQRRDAAKLLAKTERIVHLIADIQEKHYVLLDDLDETDLATVQVALKRMIERVKSQC